MVFPLPYQQYKSTEGRQGFHWQEHAATMLSRGQANVMWADLPALQK